MSLLDRFRPEWKHTDADVRADAVRQLGPSAKQTLAEVARTDPEAKIRSIAVRKIEDVELLREIAGSDDDSKVAALADERADQLLAAAAAGEELSAALDALGKISANATLVQVVKTAPLKEVRDHALDRISDPEDLLEVARHARETESRKQAVERIDDLEALTTLALREKFGELALAALARLDDPRIWLRIAEGAEVKIVREEAGRRLDALSDEEHPTRLARRRSRQLELIARVEELAGSDDWEAARDSIESARSAWLEMGAAEDDELGQKFFGARERFIQRFKEHLGESRRPAPETVKPEAARADAGAEPAGSGAPATAGEAEPAAIAPETLEEEAPAEQAPAQAAPLDEGPPVESPAVESPAVESPAAEAPTQEGPTEVAPPEAPAVAPPALEPAADPADREGASASEAPEGVAEGAPAPEGETPAAAGAAKKDAGPQETPEQAVARLRSLCDRLDSMTSSEHLNLRKAERALREAHSELTEGGPAHSHQDWPAIKKHLETARETLVPRVRQIEQEEEWKRWANVPLQEALCERMEALIEADNLGHASRELRALSEEWKTVATVPREKSEELWQRFRGAREKVREKVKVFLQEQDKERKENFQKKTVLCEQAEELADSSEWRDTAAKLKALQTEWKAIGPVPRKVSDQIWKRFRAACDQFFNRRKEHFAYLDKEREQNLEKKTSLCQEAETLADSTDWDTTTDKIKRLQARWKEIGPVPRKVSDQIWKRFRAACDRFFDRRSRKDELPLEDNLKQKEAALTELAALLPAPEPPKAKAKARTKAEAAKKAEEASKPEADGEAAAETAGRESAEATPEAAEPGSQDPAGEPPAEESAPTESAPTEAAAAGGGTPEEADPEKADPEKADPEKADPEKADPEKADSEKADPEKADSEKADSEKADSVKAAAEEAPAEGDDSPPEGPPAHLAEAVRSALQSWNAAGEVPSSRRAALDKRFAELSAALMETYPEGLEGTELDPKALADRRRSLVDRADAILGELKADLKDSGGEPEPSLEDLAQQLKEAFAANTIRKGAQVSQGEDRFRKARGLLRGLRERWRELPGEADSELAKRFDQAFKDLEKLEKEHQS